MPSHRLSNYTYRGIEVVNMAITPDFGERPGDIRVDRTTPYGNPFRMQDSTDSERDRVCDLYRDWLLRRLLKNPLWLHPLMGARRLGCWCAPKRCHAEALAVAIAEAREREA
jgi:hypothetical protein